MKDLKNEKVFIEIPSELEVKQEIKSIVDRGLVKDVKSNVKRNTLVAAAAVIFVSLFALGFAFPGYASQIPLIGGIFGMFDAHHHRDYSALQGVAHDVSDVVNIVELLDANLTVNILEDGLIEIINERGDIVKSGDLQDWIDSVILDTEGMLLTINDVVFDGQNVYFTYHITTERMLSENSFFEMSAIELWVDGVNVIDSEGFGVSPGILQRISENNYIAVATIFLPAFSEIVEYADLYFTLGTWQVELPIELTEVEVIEVNETINYELFEATVTRVLISQIGGVIYYHYSMPIEYGWLEWEFFRGLLDPRGSQATLQPNFRDDLGNEYDWESLTTSWDGGSHARGSITIREPLHPEASELIITLLMDINDWYLGDWRDPSDSGVCGVSLHDCEEFRAAGGSAEHRQVIIGEIIVPLP